MKIIWPHHFLQNQLFSARKRKLFAQMLALEREREASRADHAVCAAVLQPGAVSSVSPQQLH